MVTARRLIPACVIVLSWATLSCASIGSLRNPFFLKTDYPRWQLIGAEKAALDTALAGRTSLNEFGGDDWAQFWMERGQRLTLDARAQEAFGHRESASQLYFQSVGMYIIATYPHATLTPIKQEAYQDSLRLFRKAVDLYGVRFERIVVERDGKRLVGYLFLPQGNGPFPCVIVSGGLDGWKEESVLWTLGMAKDLLASGIAAFFVDMPGTGENTYALGPGAGEAYQRAIDDLLGRPEIDPGRLGIAGISFGGYWATWLAIHEQRIKSAVNIGGPIDRAFSASHHPAG